MRMYVRRSCKCIESRLYLMSVYIPPFYSYFISFFRIVKCTRASIIFIQLYYPIRMVLAPYLSYANAWQLTVPMMLLIAAETIILSLKVIYLFWNRTLCNLIIAAEFLVLLAAVTKVYDMEYLLRTEFQVYLLVITYYFKRKSTVVVNMNDNLFGTHEVMSEDLFIFVM